MALLYSVGVKTGMTAAGYRLTPNTAAMQTQGHAGR